MAPLIELHPCPLDRAVIRERKVRNIAIRIHELSDQEPLSPAALVFVFNREAIADLIESDIIDLLDDEVLQASIFQSCVRNPGMSMTEAQAKRRLNIQKLK